MIRSVQPSWQYATRLAYLLLGDVSYSGCQSDAADTRCRLGVTHLSGHNQRAIALALQQSSSRGPSILLELSTHPIAYAQVSLGPLPTKARPSATQDTGASATAKKPVDREPQQPRNHMCPVHRGAGGAVAACTSAKRTGRACTLCGRGPGKAAFVLPFSRGSDVRHLHEITARPFTG